MIIIAYLILLGITFMEDIALGAGVLIIGGIVVTGVVEIIELNKK
jgi:hypothetical protein